MAICPRCEKIFTKETKFQKICNDCKVVTITCIDCKKRVNVKTCAHRQIRCNKCKHKHLLEYSENYRKIYKGEKLE